MEKTKIISKIVSDYTWEYDNNGFLTKYNSSTVNVEINGIIHSIIVRKKNIYSDELMTNINDVFSNLNNIEIDTNNIKLGYTKSLMNIKKLDKKNKTKYYTDKYYKLWFFDIDDVNIDGLTITPQSIEEYVNGKVNGYYIIPYITITYKNISSKVLYANVSILTNNNNFKYVLNGEVTKCVRRNYSTMLNLATKYTKLVDFKIGTDKANESYINICQQKHNDDYKLLTDNFGDIITFDLYNNKNYCYYINLDDNNKSSISVNRNKINGDYIFNLGSFKQLTKKQIQAIISIFKI